jgi:hypothetical protein
MDGARHFEKRGRLRLFRRIGAAGPVLKLAIGTSGYSTTLVSVKYPSARAAQRAAGVWARWALEAGYAEVALGACIPGVLSTLKGPGGPGRVRTDEPEDVYFAAGAAVAPALAVGQRVLLEGVRRRPGLEVDFMFGSDFEARRVLPFPETKWSRFSARPDPDERTRRSLLALAGDAIGGHARRARPLADARCGSLIYAYEKGIHRFLKTGRLKGVGAVVFHEAVLTSALKRQSSPVLECIPAFCELVPEKLAAQLERHNGLGNTPP